MQTLPMLKKKTLTEILSLPVDKEMRDEIYRLKSENGINITEWMRQVLRRELANLKNSL